MRGAGPVLLATIVGLASLVLAVVALQHASTDKTRIRNLEHELRSTTSSGQRSVEGQIEVSEGRIKTLEEKVSKDHTAVAYLVNCVPELQTEIGTLAINWRIEPSYSTKEDSFTIAHTKEISRDCESTLYGGSGERSPNGG